VLDQPESNDAICVAGDLNASRRNSDGLPDAVEDSCVGMNVGDGLPEPSSALVIGLDMNGLNELAWRCQGRLLLYSALGQGAENPRRSKGCRRSRQSDLLDIYGR